MSELSHYESRSGRLSCTPRELFDFVTDIRNLEQFVPAGTIHNWESSADTCSFSVSMVGTVSVRIAEKEPCTKVIFNGDALKKNDFVLVLNIDDSRDGSRPVPAAVVKVMLDAELNPMLKMIANKPILQFLEILIREMEAFHSWNNIKK